MSFDAHSEEQLDTIGGGVVTLLVEGRAANRSLGRQLVRYAVRKKLSCTIFDVDALYSSNSDYIFGSLADDEARSVEVLIPLAGSDLTSEIAEVVSADRSGVLIIDSFNSIYHLLTTMGRSPRSRNLAFALAFLSYLARNDGRTVFITKYIRSVEGRVSAYDTTDRMASVTLKGGVLSMEEGSAAGIRSA